MSDINQQLAALYTSFGQNVLKDENDGVLVLEKESDLAGLPQSVRDGAAEEAAGRGLKGKWAVSNTRSSVEPFLTYSDRRDLRQKMADSSIKRSRRADHNAPTSRKSCSCGPARSCSGSRRMRTGASRTRWPRRRSARWR
jgi:Zn-dependent oligopeptidase